MPIKSRAQQRLMYASVSGYTNKVPKKVAEDFIESTPKSSFKGLKEYFHKKMAGGGMVESESINERLARLISEHGRESPEVLKAMEDLDKPAETPLADPIDLVDPSALVKKGVVLGAKAGLPLVKAGVLPFLKGGIKNIVGEESAQVASKLPFHLRAAAEKADQAMARKLAGRFNAEEANAIAEGIQKPIPVMEKIEDRLQGSLKEQSADNAYSKLIDFIKNKKDVE